MFKIVMIDSQNKKIPIKYGDMSPVLFETYAEAARGIHYRMMLSKWNNTANNWDFIGGYIEGV